MVLKVSTLLILIKPSVHSLIAYIWGLKGCVGVLKWDHDKGANVSS